MKMKSLILTSVLLSSVAYASDTLVTIPGDVTNDNGNTTINLTSCRISASITGRLDRNGRDINTYAIGCVAKIWNGDVNGDYAIALGRIVDLATSIEGCNLQVSAIVYIDKKTMQPILTVFPIVAHDGGLPSKLLDVLCKRVLELQQ
jgi:hypothetical protein